MLRTLMLFPVRSSIIIVAAALLLAVPPAEAQVAPPPGTSAQAIQEQISSRGLQSAVLQRLQQSGMSESQVRQRLASMGYDPSTLDPYLSGDAEPPEQPSGSAISAAQALGLLQPAEVDSVETEVREPADSTALEREREVRVFGLEVFRRTTSEFQPVTTGPVPPSYRVGPGDELVLFLTGDVEKSYDLPVTREGFVVIPQVGQVWVNGLTMAEIRDQMYTYLGRSYSGVSRGPDATTHFQLTLGQLRPNQVFVTGQVAEPGTYLVNAVASALNALYLGGGPLPTGSFRDVRVMRAGELAHRLDLYEYLLEGDNLSDIRLEPGDVIFVPVPHDQVSIEGEVARPAIYELMPGETLVDLIGFAGGLNAPAYTRRAQITRILPPEERTEPGVDRVTMDVDLAAALADPEAAPALEPGDDVRVYRVQREVRNTVAITGGVWHPGAYRLEPGLRAWDLIRRAEGLKEDAYRGRAQIVRIDPGDSTRTVIPFTLDVAADGTPVANPELREYDTVRVFSRSDFTTDFPVSISGEVREPVSPVFEEGMTLRDLILRARGILPTADLTIEIARLPDAARRGTDTIAEILQVTVDSSFLVSEQARQYHMAESVADDGPAAEFTIEPYDRVTVRQLPDFQLQRSVELRGHVRQPGHYTLQERDECLSTVIRRAGGLRPEAYAGGARFFRNGVRVNVDLGEAVEGPGCPADIALLDGDSLFVPEYNPVVVIQGAVNGEQPVAIQFRPGAGLGYYINNAGGYARNADEDRVHVRYANGEGAAVGRFLMFSSAPELEAGAVVTVPFVRDEDRVNVPSLISDIAQIAATLTTIALVIARL
ncbi:MAG: SLBB domain-containing protein [Longimicrobiales bacterium]